jgi:hypothetical protein
MKASLRFAWRGGVVLFFLNAAMAYAYSGGSGIAGDPYQIANKADLLELASMPADYNKHFILLADIDLSGTNFTTAVIAPDTDPSASGFQGAGFSGVFNGAGFSIHNLSINTGTTENDYLGLFGQVSAGAFISRLGLENATVHVGSSSFTGGPMLLGSLCAETYGTISNCFSTGSVYSPPTSSDYSKYAGGLVGGSQGTILDSFSSADVVSGGYVGGLAGYLQNGTIARCFATGSVSGDKSLGGLVGWAYSGLIKNCYATGSVAGNESVGGFVGSPYQATIRACVILTTKARGIP